MVWESSVVLHGLQNNGYYLHPKWILRYKIPISDQGFVPNLDPAATSITIKNKLVNFGLGVLGRNFGSESTKTTLEPRF